jgi:sulfur carrier protein ThiS
LELEVRLVTPFVESAQPSGLQRVTLPDAATVSDLLTSIGIREDGSLVVMVNGRRVDSSTALSSGNRVSVMRPIGGG